MTKFKKWKTNCLNCVRRCAKDQNMKYRKLLAILQNLSEEQLDQDVAVYVGDMDEFFPVSMANVVDEEQDVLDPGHLVLTTE